MRGMKRNLVIFALLAFVGAAAFAQTRESVRIYVQLDADNPSHMVFFRERFEAEIEANGYSLASRGTANYILNLAVRRNVRIYEDGTRVLAQPEEKQFILQVGLTRVADNAVIVSFSSGFTELTEIDPFYLFFQIMTNLPYFIRESTPAAPAVATPTPAPATRDPEPRTVDGFIGPAILEITPRVDETPAEAQARQEALAQQIERARLEALAQGRMEVQQEEQARLEAQAQALREAQAREAELEEARRKAREEALTQAQRETLARQEAQAQALKEEQAREAELEEARLEALAQGRMEAQRETLARQEAQAQALREAQAREEALEEARRKAREEALAQARLEEQARMEAQAQALKDAQAREAELEEARRKAREEALAVAAAREAELEAALKEAQAKAQAQPLVIEKIFPPTQPPAYQPPVTTQPPAYQPPVTTQPPVVQPPVTTQPPVTIQPPVTTQPPVTIQPPVTTQPPVATQPQATTPSTSAPGATPSTSADPNPPGSGNLGNPGNPSPTAPDAWRNKILYFRASADVPLGNFIRISPTSGSHRNIMPGATLGLELQFLNWMSAEVDFVARLADWAWGFNPGAALQVKFPLKPANLMMEPYLGAAYTLNRAPNTLTTWYLEAGGGFQLGFKAGPGAMFFDANFMYTFNNVLNGFTKTIPIITNSDGQWSRFAVGLGVGYKFGFVDRK